MAPLPPESDCIQPGPPGRAHFPPWPLKFRPPAEEHSLRTSLPALGPTGRLHSLLSSLGRCPACSWLQSPEAQPRPWLAASWPQSASHTRQRVIRPCSEPGFSLAALGSLWLLCPPCLLPLCSWEPACPARPPPAARAPAQSAFCWLLCPGTHSPGDPNSPASWAVLLWSASHPW